MPDIILEINEVSSMTWGALFVALGAVLVVVKAHDAGLMLVGGGLALLQPKAHN